MTEKKPDEEELQRRYLELQLLGKQIKQGQQQIEMLDEQLESMTSTISSLDSLKKAKPGTEMLSVLSEGLFIKSTITDNEELIVNVGGNVAVTKTIEETKELLKNRISMGHTERDRLLTELQTMVEYAKQAEEELTSMME